MRKSFVKQPSPVLAGVVREKTVRGAMAMIRNCEYHGANVLDLHLSCLDEEARTVESLKRIINSTKLPMLGLSYNQAYDTEPLNMTEEERIELLWRFVEAGGAAIDVQGYTYDRPSKTEFNASFSNMPQSFVRSAPKEVVMDEAVIEKQKALIQRAHEAGAEVLLSTHTGVYLDCDQVVELAKYLEKRGADILKIVTPCDTLEQAVGSMRTMLTLKKEVAMPTHLHCSGEAGQLTRILNPLLGGYLIFCCDGYTESSTFGQLDLQTAKRLLDDLKKLM